MSARFSFIIPVYNSVECVRECLESVLSQTIDDFEILVIDDGSNDNSGSIIAEYVEQYGNIKYFYKQNGGVSSARNVGLEHATGDYLCFIDADDFIEPCFLEELSIAMGEDADSSMGGFRIVSQKGEEQESIIPENKEIESQEENIRGFYDFKKKNWQHYLWNRMFRASVIRENSIRFHEDIYYKEDGLFVIEFLLVSNGLVGRTNQVIYNYRCNPNGAMAAIQSSFNPKLLTNLSAHQRIISLLRKNNISDDIEKLALEQAKSVANWISISMFLAPRKSLFMFISVEKTMFQILGCLSYFSWRGHQLLNKWK